MNRALAPDNMLNCTDMTVLERQRAGLKCQQDQFLHQQHTDPCSYKGNFAGLMGSGIFADPGRATDHVLVNSGLGSCLITRSVVAPDMVVENGWPHLVRSVEVPGTGFGCGGYGEGSGHQLNYGLAAADAKVKESVSSEKMSVTTVRSESFKKRRFDKVGVEEDAKEKKIKGWKEEGEDSKMREEDSTSTNTKSITKKNNNKKENSSNDTSKDNSKITEVQKPDYIHVRARRGQATDSHSLAERVRREKISERMKYLQDLVPGCNKITGKAGMLDEIINYVQSLQRQVEFLSMKLSAVNPSLDFNIDDIFVKEVFSASSSSFPNIGIPSSQVTNPAYDLQFNPMQQVVSCSGMEMGINPNSDMDFRRSIRPPLSIPDTFLNSSFFNHVQAPSTLDTDLQNFYNNLAFDQGRSSTSFPSQPQVL